MINLFLQRLHNDLQIKLKKLLFILKAITFENINK
jgi:hypothetical protein